METSRRFGEFELYPERFELCRAGHALRLERKPMEMLILLTVNGGRVVTRTEIAEHLWGSDVFVDTEHGINTAVRKLRQALRDDPEKPRYIQTIPKLGYRFLAPVSTHPEVAVTPVAPSTAVEAGPAVGSGPSRSRNPWLVATLGLTALCLLAALARIANFRAHTAMPEVHYEQLTDLTDSAVAPAISPDGRTVAFLRGDDSFGSSGPIYAKALPNGELRLISKDPRPKYGLTFTPDGSRIAYTVFGRNAFATYSVSVFGGDPSLVLNNAAGLSWVRDDQLLFSEIHSGIHLGVVTGTVSGGATRDVYFPAPQRGMAHFSKISPDGRWVLIVEMDSTGQWAPCRLVGFKEGGEARAVGPVGPCTATAWSPDGRWMYFVALIAGESHLWRQRFPDGQPQQITFGAGEEDGLVTDTGTGSLITSIGTAQSALWVHDDRGERALSSEGEVLNGTSPPVFRNDDAVLYYLLRRRAGSAGAELWRVDPRTENAERVLEGDSLLDFDVSADGKQVVYAEAGRGGGGGELWLAPTDRSSLPVRLGVEGAAYPHFGPGRILFQTTEGTANYLEQIGLDGRGRARLVPFPIHQLQGVSPGGHWAVAMMSEAGAAYPTVIAIPFDGSGIRSICAGYCVPRWSSGGGFLWVPEGGGAVGSPGQSLVFPLGPNERLPQLPPDGIRVLPAAEDEPGAKRFPRGDSVPGRDPEHYAFVKTTVQRNLFRVTAK